MPKKKVTRKKAKVVPLKQPKRASKKAVRKAPQNRRKKTTRKPGDKRASGQSEQVKRKRAAVLKSLKGGAHVNAACDAAGLGRTTFYDMLATDPDFAAKVEQAQAQPILSVECAMYRRAKSMTYPGAVTAGIFLLKNKLPEIYKDVQDHNIHAPGDRVEILKKLAEGADRGLAKTSDGKGDA